MIKISPNDECPCDSGRKYKKCCRPYMDSKLNPKTPLELVRARFTAYALQNVDFIMDTTHPESSHFNKNENRWRAELDAYSFRSFFTQLNILSADDDKVSYKITMLQFGVEESQYIEHATFKQYDGHWHYFDSEMEEIEEDAAASDEDTDNAPEEAVEASVNETKDETEEA